VDGYRVTTAWATDPVPVAQAAPPTSWYTTPPVEEPTEAGSWQVRFVEKATVAHGNGALSARAAPRVFIDANLAGSGQAAAATTVTAPRPAHAAGNGWLWANVYIAGSTLAEFSGRGALSASTVADGLRSKAIPSESDAANIGGHGAMTGLVTGIKVFIPANLAGHGGLAGEFPIPVQLRGAGSLQADVIAGLARAANLSGHGALSMVPNDGLHGTVAARSPTLEQGAGHGALSIRVSQIYRIAPALAGRGQMSGVVNSVKVFGITGALGGSGQLFGAKPAQAFLVGAGQLQAVVAAGYGVLGRLAGSGLLVVVPNDGLHAGVVARSPSAELGTGHGALAVLVSQIYNVPGALHGQGAVNAVISPRQYVNANLTGGGALHAATATAAELVGAGQLQAVVAAGYGRVGALGGKGVLSASPNDGLHGTVYEVPFRTELGAGHGALTVAAFARYSSAAHPAGHGAIAATYKQICPTSPALPGHGVISAAARMYQLRVAAALSGRGVVSALVEQEYTRLGQPAGHGVVSATARMYSIHDLANLTGHGALSAATYPKMATGAGPAGHGALSGAARMYRIAVPTSPGGAGALHATATASYAAAPTLVGSGALSAAARIYKIASAAQPAGHGALSAHVVPISAAIATTAGRGALVAAWVQKYGPAAQLAGQGTMAGNVSKIVQHATATLSGSGSLSGVAATPARLVGVGQLQAAVAGGFVRSVALTGQGVLYTAPNDGLHAGVYPKPAALESGTGHGALSILTKQIYTIPGQPAGHGALSAAARLYKINEAAPLPGHGLLAASATAKYSSHAAPSGQGLLSVTAKQQYQKAVALPGHGALSYGAAMAQYLRAAPLPGHGVVSATATILWPSFDAASAGATSSSSPASLAAGAFTVTGNLIVLGVVTFAGEIGTAKVGTTSMTAFGAEYNNNSSGNGGVQLFYLLNSGLTGSQNPTASWVTHPTYALAYAMSFNHVHNVGSINATFGDSTGAHSLTVTALVNGIVISALSGYSFGNPPMSSFVGTQKFNSQLGTYVQMMMGYTVASIAATPIGATLSSSGTNYAYEGFAIS
jgi:hypothetical protein